jgi:uroporphyrinogen decarboxylase
MNSRERLILALNHREPDRVPIDLGGTSTSTISLRALENLKSYLGLTSGTRVMNPVFMTAYPGDDVLERFHVDVKMIAGKPPSGFTLQGTQEGRVVDEWGIVYQKHETAQTHFIAESEAPLRGVASKDEIDRYPWPDPTDPSRVRDLRQTAKAYRDEGFGVVVNTSLLVMTQTQWMRGLEQFMLDMVLDPGLLGYMMDKILEIAAEMARRLLEEVGDYADVVVMGDDLSHQGGLTYSPEMYRRLLKPRHKQIVELLRKHAGNAKILYHCCGGVEPLIRDLIDLGIDAINPVQVGAKGMEDTRKLKTLYGKELTFWGGIDTQWVLPFGTSEDVRTEVRRRIEDMAVGGGFVLAAVHNIRPEVKPENICALFDAAHECGKYPIRVYRRR